MHWVSLCYFSFGASDKPCLNEEIDKNDNERDKKFWFTAIDMITVILKVDVLYSSILALSNTSDKCSDTSFRLSISFVLLCILLGWLYMFIRIGDHTKTRTQQLNTKG